MPIVTGRCGSQRVREMMDRDGDGSIDRDGYIGWASTQAGRDFDSFAGDRGAVEAGRVYEHFRSLEYHQRLKRAGGCSGRAIAARPSHLAGVTSPSVSQAARARRKNSGSAKAARWICSL